MATINISLKNILGVDISTSVTIKLLDDILIDGVNIVAGTKQSVPTNSAGDATVTLYAGNYLIYILDRKPLRFAVPTGNATLNLVDLIDADSTPIVTPNEVYEVLSNKGVANGYAALGSDGKIAAGQLPPSVDVSGKENKSEKNQPNGYAGLSGGGLINAAQIPGLPPSQVGLNNVDNTSDLDKPISNQTKDLFRVLKDDTVRVTAIFPGYNINQNDNSRTPLIQLSSDLNYRMFGGLKFVLLSPNTNPATNTTYISDRNALLPFFQDPTFLGRVIITNFETKGSSVTINGGQFDAVLSDYVDYHMAYKTANPEWNPEIIIKLNHETNLTASYEWAAVNSINLADAGGDLDVSIANWALGFRRLSNLIRRRSCVDQYGVPIPAASVPLDVDGVPVYSYTCRPFIMVAHELAVASANGGEEDLLKYTPGYKYFDCLFFNPYNRYLTTSGDGEWRTLEQFTKNAFLNVAPIMAPNKILGIGETATMSGGRVTDQYSGSFSSLVGGTGFPANQVNQPVPDSAIFCDGVKPPILYNTDGSGVVTSLVAPNGGEENTYVTIASSWLGGTGFSVVVRVKGLNFSKARWYTEAIEWCKSIPNLRYLNFFWQNKGTVTTTNRQDYRDWAPNSAQTKRAVSKALRNLNARATVPTTPIYVSNPNFCPDPGTSNLAVWTQAGTNQGVLSLDSTEANNFADSPEVTSVLKLTHNGTLGAFDTNRFYFYIPAASNPFRSGQKITITCYAKGNPTTQTGIDQIVTPADPHNPKKLYFRMGLENNDSPFNYSGRFPPFILETYFQRFETYTSAVTGGTGWRGCFQIGANDIPFNFFVTAIKFEAGDKSTAVVLTPDTSAKTSVANTWTVKQTYTGSSTTAPFRFGSQVRPSSPSEGDQWYDSVNKVKQSFIGSIRVNDVYSIPNDLITQSTVANTTTATDLVTTSLPSGFWTVAKKLEAEYLLRYGTDTVAPTLNLEVYLGTNLLGAIGAKTLSASLSGANQGLIKVNFSMYCNSIATSGSNLSVAGKLEILNPVAGTSNIFQFLDIGSKACDTSSTQTLRLVATWNTASANNTITSRLPVLIIK